MKLDIYTDCNTYIYRGFTFIHYKGGDLIMVAPDWYEVGVHETDLFIAKDILDIENALIDGIVDYYDFANRDMERFPITEEEKRQIKSSFTDKEIELWFPTVKKQYAQQKMMEKSMNTEDERITIAGDAAEGIAELLFGGSLYDDNDDIKEGAKDVFAEFYDEIRNEIDGKDVEDLAVLYAPNDEEDCQQYGITHLHSGKNIKLPPDTPIGVAYHVKDNAHVYIFKDIFYWFDKSEGPMRYRYTLGERAIIYSSIAGGASLDEVNDYLRIEQATTEMTPKQLPESSYIMIRDKYLTKMKVRTKVFDENITEQNMAKMWSQIKSPKSLGEVDDSSIK